MPTNQQRRESERRRLQRQLEERRAREAARRRYTLIGSIIGTLVVIGVVVVIVVATSGGKSKSASHDTITSPPTSSAPASSTAAQAGPPAAPCSAPPKGATATFAGVTVQNATDVKTAPKITSKASGAVPSVLCQDLVVGTGKAATPTSKVTVQYSGVLYKDGTAFDSSWSRGGKPVQFALTGVVQGFAQGIGGAGKVAPMHSGGRRTVIMPAVLAYGSSGSGAVPPNADLVFVIDLVSVDG